MFADKPLLPIHFYTNLDKSFRRVSHFRKSFRIISYFRTPCRLNPMESNYIS